LTKKGSISWYSRIFTVASLGALPYAIREERLLRLRHHRACEVVLVDRVVFGRHGPVQQWQDVAKDARRVGVAKNDGGPVHSKEVELDGLDSLLLLADDLRVLHPGLGVRARCCHEPAHTSTSRLGGAARGLQCISPHARRRAAGSTHPDGKKPRRALHTEHGGIRKGSLFLRHHRLLELFLHDVLRYSWDEVHEEAERLEHYIFDRFEDRVAAILGDSEIDPHGHVIPQKYAAGVYREEVPLVGWPLQAPATISSVSDRSPAALRELERLGLMPGRSLLSSKGTRHHRYW
jgi:hypothetical protein